MDQEKPSYLDDNNSDVTAPVPAYNERLIMDDLSSSGRSDTDFSSLFALSPELINKDTLYKALKKSASENKLWLIVNIQDESMFECHCLNRDVWRSETIQAIISTYYSFWQRSHTDADGSEFCHLYNINKFPHISILDTRTGTQVKVWKSHMFSDELSAVSELLDFADQVNCAMKEQEKITEIPAPPVKPVIDLTEDSDEFEMDAFDLPELCSEQNNSSVLGGCDKLTPVTQSESVNQSEPIRHSESVTQSKSVNQSESVNQSKRVNQSKSASQSISESKQLVECSESTSSCTKKSSEYSNAEEMDLYRNTNALLKALHEERLKRLNRAA